MLTYSACDSGSAAVNTAIPAAATEAVGAANTGALRTPMEHIVMLRAHARHGSGAAVCVVPA